MLRGTLTTVIVGALINNIVTASSWASCYTTYPDHHIQSPTEPPLSIPIATEKTFNQQHWILAAMASLPFLLSQLESYDENASSAEHAKATAKHELENVDRQVLGHLSPNAKVKAPTAELLKRKPKASSPLKRGFTADIEGEQGLTYIKRRKYSEDKRLSEGMSTTSRAEQPEWAQPNVLLPTIETVQHQSSPCSSLFVDMVQEPQDRRSTGGSTTTEPNTPSDRADPHNSQPSSAEHASFSSLINYDISSQQPSTSQQPPFPRSIACKAETLKARLQVAMYKVRTNQISKTFDELSIPEDMTPKSKQDVIEEAVAALRREAQLTQPLHDRPAPRLRLDFPILKPSAYSSRMLYDSVVHSSIPTSRPILQQQPHQYIGITTPKASRDALLKLEESATPEGDLTSSVVKGSVAEGLLHLRNAS